MTTFAGRDYYTVSHHLTALPGLVSDPPQYARCVAKLEAAAASSPTGQAKETAVQLLSKCRELYEALRIQATGFLVSAQRAIDLAREMGITVTAASVQAFSRRVQAADYASEAQFRHFLESTGETQADSTLEAKVELLGAKVLKKIAATAGRERYVIDGGRWDAGAVCQPGYVVEYCKEFTGGTTYPSTPPPSVLMEQVAALVTGRCINVAACAEQASQPAGK
ncbi:MAG: hypothetical protein E7812_08725 [Phenylobacterium sp.]|nr:MAG: hypothetical protein E7812_08725 [Phenylobacterium sp.]